MAPLASGDPYTCTWWTIIKQQRLKNRTGQRHNRVQRTGCEKSGLEASEKEGLTILWVAVSASSYQWSRIADYQAAHDPSRPLDALGSAALSKELVRIAKKIWDAASSV